MSGLPENGRVVAPPGVRPESWLGVLLPESNPLVLAPASSGGWFAGRAVVAWSPEAVAGNLTLREAGDELRRSFSAEKPTLTVALLPYQGTAAVARYSGGLVRTEAGWRLWGELDASDAPAVNDIVYAALPPEVPLAVEVHTDMGAAAFRAGVRAIAEAVRAGDVYVLNLTRRLTGTPAAEPGVAFATLVERTGAEMAAYWGTERVRIASASPERFLKVTGDLVQVSPIKGTRPRAEGDADAAMAAELASSEKERAEHVMIVDLERNDLGRVCRPGTVSVDPLFEVVATPYCHQMISTVSGSLRENASLADLLQAAFPCGSVTGAPKISAMRHIAALEVSSRDAYTGSLAVAVPGELDSSVLIRTAEYADGIVRWGSGGGITVDSDPAEEWLETVLKASPLCGNGPPPVALRETCRVVRGEVPLLARHLARLAAGGCGPSVLARVRAAVTEATRNLDGAERRRLGVTVEPTGEVTAQVTEAASSLDVPGGPELLPVRCAAPPLPAGAAKPAGRAPWDEAQARAVEAGAHQAVLVDARGLVIDGATASVWVRLGERLLTPPAPPAVDGVARGVVLDAAASLGYAAEESELPVELLAQADEVFLSNALAGVVAARGRSGPATTALIGVFAEVFR